MNLPPTFSELFASLEGWVRLYKMGQWVGQGITLGWVVKAHTGQHKF